MTFLMVANALQLARHHHRHHPLENGHGVATSRIDKYESADWRQDVVREKLSRFKTVSQRVWVYIHKRRDPE